MVGSWLFMAVRSFTLNDLGFDPELAQQPHSPQTHDGVPRAHTRPIVTLTTPSRRRRILTSTAHPSGRRSPYLRISSASTPTWAGDTRERSTLTTCSMLAWERSPFRSTWILFIGNSY